jgi:hypothetical protein
MTRLSNLQFPMLRTFVESGSGFYMRIDEAQRYDQRPFRSMLIREWIAYTPGRGFHITRKGRDAWDEFQQTEIWRKNPDSPLTAFFDPDAYGLKDPYRKKAAVHVMPRRVA